MAQELITIAKIRTGFTEKFGIPRQSGLVDSTVARIVFEPEYRTYDALKGLEEFSHIWLLWEFSEAKYTKFNATVTPPRLGGKVHKGVFATRSPYRPNSIGLSSVKLLDIQMDEKNGPVLLVSGADMLDNTPIYDIKPYLAYTDSHPDADSGYAARHQDDRIEVDFPEDLRHRLPENLRQAVYDILAQDPRAAYNKKPDYVYGMNYEKFDIRFKITDNKIQVCDVVDISKADWDKVK